MRMPSPRLPSCTWPADTVIGREPVGLYDVDHEQPARFYRTNRGVTNGYLDGADPTDQLDLIPMGYTNLDNHEQVAVALDGQVLREWAPRARSETFVVLVPPAAGQDLVFVQVSHPQRFALAALVNLSARLPTTPLLLSRQRSSVSWH